MKTAAPKDVTAYIAGFPAPALTIRNLRRSPLPPIHLAQKQKQTMKAQNTPKPVTGPVKK